MLLAFGHSPVRPMLCVSTKSDTALNAFSYNTKYDSAENLEFLEQWRPGAGVPNLVGALPRATLQALTRNIDDATRLGQDSYAQPESAFKSSSVAGG